ncbi:hypothetical protein MPEAHAMD_3276 [Methylobacterium frigidaeris]|uniref:Uncharacterized protein n=1 Tax=Methylobacterium frigidaeris TaxID=2038277 RepID=A0AA37M5M2_9HYPH|nr:hypothetical protein MPEAHAMD_3276 [Methylobacterium frigidaeris]
MRPAQCAGSAAGTSRRSGTRGARGARIRLDGPEVKLRSSVIQTLALSLHELATNARKGGALATGRGRLAVT